MISRNFDDIERENELYKMMLQLVILENYNQMIFDFKDIWNRYETIARERLGWTR